MRLAVVRHGQTDWNIQRRYQGWEGTELNAAGREQAALAAQTLVSAAQRTGARWRWLASSNARRAVETANIVGSRLGLTLGEQLPDLIERGFGAAEGMSISLARLKWPMRDYPGGESLETVRERVVRAVDALALSHHGVDGVVVTHGTVLRVVVEHVSGQDPGSLPNAAIAVLDGEPGEWRVALASWLPD